MGKRWNNHKLSKVGEPGSTVCFVCLKWVMDQVETENALTKTLLDTANANLAPIMSDLSDLRDFSEAEMAKLKTQSINAINLSTTVTMGAVILGVFLSAIIGFTIASSLSSPLSRLTELSEEVAQGSLKVDLTKIDRSRKDEIGRLGSAFGTMVDKVMGDMIVLIKQVQISSEEVASSAEELASTSEEVNALSEEIAATIQQISRGASNQSELSTKAIEDVSNMAAMVDKSLKDIEGTLQVIEDIAGQTNILALNAAIEAARAGEFGRGFAVVADNVRRLAEETKSNSADITQLTDEIVSSIGGSVQSLQDTLQGFAAQSEEFSASSEEVAAATEEQTAAMHQMTTAAQELTKQGKELAQLVSQFELPE